MPGFCFFACDLPATIQPVGVGFRIFAEAMGEQRAPGRLSVAMRLSLGTADARFQQIAIASAIGRVAVSRRLPFFDEQKKTRLRSHLSA